MVPSYLSNKPFGLERHRYGVTEKVELQHRMQAVTINKNLAGVEDVQLNMLGTFNEAMTEFAPGDFAVLRDARGAAWSWGRVSLVRSTTKREPRGVLTNSPYSVAVQGWFDFLSRTRLHVFETQTRPSEGTLFSIIEWHAIMAQLNSMHKSSAGMMLQYMLQQLLRIRLPESLGGGWLYEQVPLVHDAATAALYAPEFADIEPVDYGDLMPNITLNAFNNRSTDIGSFLTNMFVPEPMLIELFPYLSYAGARAVPGVGSPVVSGPAGTAAIPAGSLPATGSDALSNILGARPVIVYRVKPFRVNPLYSAAVSKISYTDENPEYGLFSEHASVYSQPLKATLQAARIAARNATTKQLVDQNYFKQVTFNPETIVPLPYHYITSVTRQRSDADRVNASSINAGPPDTSSQISVGAFEPYGLPITQKDQIEKHGLRLRLPTWPFYAPNATPPQDLIAFYRAVAAQVMQFYQTGHLYETGTMTAHFTHAVVLKDPPPAHASWQPITRLPDATEQVPGIEPGRWFRTPYFGGLDLPMTPPASPAPAGTPPGVPTGAPEYFGYINAVAHTIQRLENGLLTAQTNINFQRGHFAEMWEVLNGVVVPMDEATPIPLQGSTYPQPPSGSITRTTFTPVNGRIPEGSKTSVNSKNHIIMAGVAYPFTPPSGVMYNYAKPDVWHLKCSTKKLPVFEIVVHETEGSIVGKTHKDVIAWFTRADINLGAHFIIDRAGNITQHADVSTEITNHAGEIHNPYSVGIEIMNPVGKASLAPPGATILQGLEWTNGGQYVVPSPPQLEALHALISWLVASSRTLIPNEWIGYNGFNNTMSMSRIWKVPGRELEPARPGIWAHAYFEHSDAAFPVLYSFLRAKRGMTPAAAYAFALRVCQADKSRRPSLSLI
jgi:hypothetical protein